MDLRLPSSGGLIESLLDGLGRSASDSAGGTIVSGVTAPQLDQALDALRQGHIEYVILEHGDTFLQAAGEGDGPYHVQFSPGPAGPMLEIRGGVRAERMRSILREYLQSRDFWRTGPEWSPLT
jgi:hypothetical protein